MAKARSWDAAMEAIEYKAKNSLYSWNLDCLKFLKEEKTRLVVSELFADAALICDEIEVPRS